MKNSFVRKRSQEGGETKLVLRDYFFNIINSIFYSKHLKNANSKEKKLQILLFTFNYSFIPSFTIPSYFYLRSFL